MVEVDALLHEELGDVLGLAPLVADLVVGAGVLVLVDRPGDAELGVGHHLEVLATVYDLLGRIYDLSMILLARIYRVTQDTGHLEILAKSQVLYKHYLDS